jgi:hypothetical protein
MIGDSIKYTDVDTGGRIVDFWKNLNLKKENNNFVDYCREKG